MAHCSNLLRHYALRVAIAYNMLHSAPLALEGVTFKNHHQPTSHGNKVGWSLRSERTTFHLTSLPKRDRQQRPYNEYLRALIVGNSPLHAPCGGDSCCHLRTRPLTNRALVPSFRLAPRGVPRPSKVEGGGGRGNLLSYVHRNLADIIRPPFCGYGPRRLFATVTATR